MVVIELMGWFDDGFMCSCGLNQFFFNHQAFNSAKAKHLIRPRPSIHRQHDPHCKVDERRHGIVGGFKCASRKFHVVMKGTQVVHGTWFLWFPVLLWLSLFQFFE